MDECRTVGVIITTHNRTRVACEVIDSLVKNLKYSGELKWIISDDRSEPGHVQTLVEQFLKHGVTPICKTTTKNRNSLGASMNNGILEAFKYGDVCLTTEDDWILQRELDITEHVETLCKNERLAAIRLAVVMGAYADRYNDRYYVLSCGKGRKSVFNNQVALRHRRVYQELGYYSANVTPDESEISYRNRFNEFSQYDVLFPNEIPLLTMDHEKLYFIHCGESTVGHTRYKVPERYKHFYEENTMNLCMVIDGNYIKQTLVMLQNIKETTLCKKCIYVLAWGIAPENKAILESVGNNLTDIRVIQVEKKYTDKCMDAGGYKRVENRYTVPPTGLLKFCIADILQDVDKILYLDGDMQVMCSLEELYNTDVNNYYCAAVPDIGSITMLGKKAFKLMQGDKEYFNSGLMLMNLRKIRANKLMDKLFAIKKARDARQLMDQDSLNVGFKGKVKLLPCKYNFMESLISAVRRGKVSIPQVNSLYHTSYESSEEFLLKKDVVIHHYAGEMKPWKPVQLWWEERLKRALLNCPMPVVDQKFTFKTDEKPRSVINSVPTTPKTISFDDDGKQKHDAVFLLGTGSRYKDSELLLAVHSMRKFCPFIDRIFIIGAKPRCKLDKYDVRHIYCDDPYRTNKDANMMNKVMFAITKIKDLSENFLLCSDDQVVTQECTWNDFKPKYVKTFCSEDAIFAKANPKDTTKWINRLYRTLLAYQDLGKQPYIYEPHIWSPVNKESFKKMIGQIKGVRYAGVIKSQYYNSIDGLDQELVHDHRFLTKSQPNWKTLFSNPPKFLSYNDGAFGDESFRKGLALLLR